MSQTREQKIVNYVTHAQAALEKASAFEQEITAKQAAAAKLIPEAVDALVASGRISADEGEKCAALLANPVDAIRVLIKVAQHRTEAELAVLGQPTPPAEKAASAPRTQYHYRNAKDSPAGQEFARRILANR